MRAALSIVSANLPDDEKIVHFAGGSCIMIFNQKHPGVPTISKIYEE